MFCHLAPCVLSTAITHTPSMPVMVRSELTESLPTPSHGAPPQDTATAAFGTSLTVDTTKVLNCTCT